VTAQEIVSYLRCGEFHRLTAIEGVPTPPSTRQIVSRAVLAAIQADLAHKIAHGCVLETAVARQNLERLVGSHLAGECALSAEEAAMGNRRIFERVLLSAQRVYLLWRGTVASRIEPMHLQRPFTLNFDASHVTGIIEIEEVRGFRATKVRSRRPEEGEASRDLALAIQSLALDGAPATVDYLIEAKELAYVRQVVEFDGGMLAAAQERVRIALQMAEAGVYLPAPADAWYCQKCSLRMCCCYVR